MKNMYEVRDLLKQFGIFVYTRSKMGDLDLIEDEIKELYTLNLIEFAIYRQAIVVIRKEKAKLK